MGETNFIESIEENTNIVQYYTHTSYCVNRTLQNVDRAGAARAVDVTRSHLSFMID